MTIKEAVEYYNTLMEEMKILNKLETRLRICGDWGRDPATLTFDKVELQVLKELVKAEIEYCKQKLRVTFKEDV